MVRIWSEHVVRRFSGHDDNYVTYCIVYVLITKFFETVVNQGFYKISNTLRHIHTIWGQVTLINEYEVDQQRYKLLRNPTGIRQDILTLNTKKFTTLV